MVVLNYYGVLTDLAGKTSENLDANEGLTFTELKSLLLRKYPGFGKYSIVFFQNSNRCALESKILKGVVADCMPPFSGG
jgi:molybdopterin converting factor small subunit